jgi:hypothetical protein
MKEWQTRNRQMEGLISFNMKGILELPIDGVHLACQIVSYSVDACR